MQTPATPADLQAAYATRAAHTPLTSHAALRDQVRALTAPLARPALKPLAVRAPRVPLPRMRFRA